MDKDRYVAYVKPFIDFFKNDPVFISNDNIKKYLEKHDYKKNPDLVLALSEYYSELNVSRYVLRQAAEETGTSGNISIQKTFTPDTSAPLPQKYDDFLNSLKLRKYSPRTLKAYSSALKTVNTWLSHNHKESVDSLNPDIALKYFLYLVNDAQASYSTVRINRFAVEYYHNIILKRTIDLSFMNKMEKGDHLPTVLTRNEIIMLLRKITNIKQSVSKRASIHTPAWGVTEQSSGELILFILIIVAKTLSTLSLENVYPGSEHLIMTIPQT